MCIEVIQQARKNVRYERTMQVRNVPLLQEPHMDAFWLLTEARDCWMPIAYNGVQGQLYKVIRSEVFRSKGFRKLLRIICDPDNPDGEILAHELDKYRIFE